MASIAQELGLNQIDVLVDLQNDNSYFTIGGLPETLTFGKHYFTLTFQDPEGLPRLKEDTQVLFELVDARGLTIHSELTGKRDVNGAAVGYVWVKQDPAITHADVADGTAKFIVAGTVETDNPVYRDKVNLRTSFDVQIRKGLPNTSPILFRSSSLIQTNFSGFETREVDNGPSESFLRSFVNISASHLDTHGGQLKYIELSYTESGSASNEFTQIATYEITGSPYEVPATAAAGLNPVSNLTKVSMPNEFRRQGTVRFKLRFLNTAGDVAVDPFANNIPIEVTSSFAVFDGTPTIIEGDDNLLTGSMFTGNAVGRGFQQSGESSAFLKTVDYTGFVSASLGIGQPGVLFFSGSILSGSGDDYEGVGLELHGGSGSSSFRFRSNPSLLEIEADKFFVGSKDTQFISGAAGNIEISSSNFHLSSSGDVRMAGTVEASAGTIGGFEIGETQINSSNDDIIFKASGQISASSILLASGSFTVDPGQLSRFGSSGSDAFQSFVMADNTGVRMQTTNFNLNTARFIISSSDVGVMAVGSNPPHSHVSGSGFYVDGDGNFLVGNSSGSRIQFDGFETTISSSKFFMGSSEQFLSGSDGNIEISSSGFHLTPQGAITASSILLGTSGLEGQAQFLQFEDGQLTIQGNIQTNALSLPALIGGAPSTLANSSASITSDGFAKFISASIAGFTINDSEIFSDNLNLRLKKTGEISGSDVQFTGGTIAAFKITNDALSTDNFFISASATGADLFISSSDFSVSATGIVSASDLSLAGGSVGGLSVVADEVTVGDVLKLKDSGDVTGSRVLFTGGRIAAFSLSDDAFSTDSFLISSSASGSEFFISSSNFQVTADGDITGSQVLFTGGRVGNFQIIDNKISGSNITFDADRSQIFKTDQGPGTDSSAATALLRNEYYLDFTPSQSNDPSGSEFFVKFGPNFAVDKTGILFASGATFEGSVTASAGLIGGFVTNATQINSTNNNLILKSSGQITGSQVLFTGGKIAAFNISDDALSTDSFFISASATGSALFISSSDFSVSAEGIVSASDLSLTGGSVGGLSVAEGTVSVGEILKLKSSGQITASNARLTGDLNATSIQASSGSIGGFLLETSRLSSANLFAISASTVDHELFISASEFKVTNKGAVTASNMALSGSISAELGDIGGFIIGPSKLSSGNLFALSASTVDHELFISSSEFKVTNKGAVTASSARIGGDINAVSIQASSGSIGGFLLEPSRLSSGNLFAISASTTADELFISSSTFKVTNTGAVSASNMQLSGSVSATSGDIGGFVIATDISSTAGTLILKGASGQITASAAQIEGDLTATNIIATGSGIIGGFAINALAISSSNGLLRLKSSGQITASNARLSGDLNATSIQADSGSIGGFLLEPFRLSSGNLFAISASSVANEIFISSSEFKVTNRGAITASNAEIKGDLTATNIIATGSGIIGGFELSSTEIKHSGNLLRLKASGQITASNARLSGDLNATSIQADSGSIGGFLLEPSRLSSGNLFAISASTTDHELFISSSQFKVTNKGAITASEAEIKGELTATRIIATGSGIIGGFALDPATISSSNNSLILRGDSGDITGSKVLLSGGKIGGFELGADIISSSNSNLLLKSSGQITASEAEIRGDITATNIIATGSGLIGGFSLTPTAISSSNNSLLLKSSGQITGSNVLLDGGVIGGFDLGASVISSSNGNLILRSSGQITGSSVLVDGGKIADFTISQDALFTDTFFLSASATGSANFISSSTFRLTAEGTATMSSALITGSDVNIDVATFELDSDNFDVTATGQVTMSAAKISGSDIDIQVGKFVLDSDNFDVAESGQVTMSAAKISGSDIDIQVSKFVLDSDNFDVTATGDITGSSVLFTGGRIGNFQILDNKISGSNITFDADRSQIFKTDQGPGTDTSAALDSLRDEYYIDFTPSQSNDPTGTEFYVKFGPNFMVDKNGILVASGATFIGTITASAGLIGGFTTDSHSLSSQNLFISGSPALGGANLDKNKFISTTNFNVKQNGDITGSQVLFTGGRIAGFTVSGSQLKQGNSYFFEGDSDKPFFISSSFFQVTPSGDVTGSSVLFDGGQIGGFTIGTNTLSATNFELDPSGKRITLGTGNNIFIADGDDGIQLGNSTFANAPFSVTKAGVLKATSGTIGGFTLGASTITSTNLVLNSSGRIETANFAKGVQGFRLDASANGSAEFENVTIRGTLATAVFEKETVNAVGGQLYVANSSVLTGSEGGIISASATTMSVVNVTGFVAGEILSAKKVSDTGFATEYILIESASRSNPSSESDFQGKLFVQRAFGSGSDGDSGSLGATPNQSQSYNTGQVVVSTGVSGSGYVRINANPSDLATPYIDIVERTGSGIYDNQLMVRLGDLTGLSSGLLFGNDNPGFGIFTQNGFFSGGITATTGSFTGVVHINTSDSVKMKLGTNVESSNDGIHINANNYWYTTGEFKLGDGTNNISHDGSGDVAINADNFTLKGGSTLLLNTTKLAFDTSNATAASRTSGTGVFMDTNGHFRVGKGAAGRLEFDGTDIIMSASKFSLGSPTSFVSGSDGNILISSSNFLVDSAKGIMVMSGSISASDGAIGGWQIGSTTLTGGVVTLNSEGSIEVGGLADATTVATTNSGFFADSSGNVLIKGNRSGTDFLKVSAGGGIDIASQVFDLDAGTLILDSATNNGKVSVGVSPPFNIAGSGSYMDGDGTFLVGSGSGERITFDGSAFIMSSSTFLLGDSSNFMSGSNGNILISGSNITLSTPTFFFGQEGSGKTFISGSNGNLRIQSTNFTLAQNGDVTMAGQISASSGDIAGIKIDPSGFIAHTKESATDSNTGFFISTTAIALGANKTFHVDSSGNMSASNAHIQGDLTATNIVATGSGIIGGFTINNNAISSSNGTLRFKSSGQITASNARLSGDLNATSIQASSGSIGGFLLEPSRLSSGNLFAISASTVDHELFISSSLFKVSNKGAITASSARIDGDINATSITATSGSIGGFLLEPTRFSADNLFAISASTVDHELFISSSQFKLTNKGAITASSARVEGDINATSIKTASGSIAGFIITENRISASTFIISSSARDGEVMISSSFFTLSNLGAITASNASLTGDLTATSIQANSGSIGGWVLGSDTLTGGNVTLSSAGTIKTGNLLNANDTATTRRGFFADNDGNVLIKGDDNGNNFLKFDFDGGASAFQVKTDNFSIIGGNVSTSGSISAATGDIGGWIIGADTLTGGSVTLDASGSIRVGTLANATTVATTNKGFFADNDGNVLIKGDDNNTNYIKFDEDGGNSTIEIKTPNFSIVSGNVSTSGSISATAGDIGGFVIASGQLSSTGGNVLIKGSTGQITASAVQLSGDLNATSIQADSGSVGGWTLGANTFTGGNVVLSSAGSIKVGSLANATTVATTNKGFFADNNGNVLIKGDDSNTNYIKFDEDGGNSTIEIKTPNFSIISGNVSTSGSISATAGDIGGFVIASGELDSTGGTVKIKGATGQITASAVELAGDLNATSLQAASGSIGGWVLGANTFTGGNVTLNSGGSIKVGTVANASTTATTNAGFFADNNGNVLIKADDNNTNFIKFNADGGAGALEIKTGNFSVDTSGNVSVAGEISASSGDFGGISIGANSIEAAGGVFSVNESGAVTATDLSSSGSISATSGDIGGFVIASGELTSTGGTVNIKGSTGQITASAVQLSGDLNATSLQAGSGSVGGWVLGTTSFTGGNVVLSSAGSIKVGSLANASTVATTNKGFFADNDGNVLIKGDDSNTNYIKFDEDGGNSTIEIKTPNFSIVSGNVSTSGSISATAGDIGGFVIASGELTSTGGTVNIKGATGQITASAVELQGDLNATSLQAASGSVGGWTLGANTFTGGNVVLNSGGSIKVGTVTDASTTATTNAGFFADNNGNVLIKGDDNNTNFIKFDADGGNGALEIKTGNFSINSDGDVAIAGEISASSGDFGGVSIGANSIVANGGVFSLSEAGALVASSATITGQISASSGDFGGVSIGANSIEAAGGVFSLSEAGALVASSATITGQISASSGDFGGVSIGQNSIEAAGGVFSVSETGAVTASNIAIAGHVSASSGEVAGFEIGGVTLERITPRDTVNFAFNSGITDRDNAINGMGSAGTGSFSASLVSGDGNAQLNLEAVNVAGSDILNKYIPQRVKYNVRNDGAKVTSQFGIYNATASVNTSNHANTFSNNRLTAQQFIGEKTEIGYPGFYRKVFARDNFTGDGLRSVVAIYVATGSHGDEHLLGSNPKRIGESYGVPTQVNNIPSTGIYFGTASGDFAMRGGYTAFIRSADGLITQSIYASSSFGHAKSPTFQGSSGSADVPSIQIANSAQGFYYDSNGINVMVQDAHEFLFKIGGEFHADADVIAFSSTVSDLGLKDNITTLTESIDKIKKIRGVEYTWNRGGRKGEKDLGVIAQEVEKVIPEIVRDKEIPLIDNSGKTYKTVDYEKLTAVLIEGVKEQQKQIDKLKQQVKELKDGRTI